jgi:hypothetical protein
MARYDNNNNPYSWMPGFLRRFLNLTYDEPQGNEPSSGPRPLSYTSAPTSAGQATWSPPSEPTFKASNLESYAPPAGSYTAQPGASYAPPASPGPLPPASNVGAAPAATTFAPGQTDGYLQPVSYLVRGYIRGALPPQGIEQFSRELASTTKAVWGMYSRMLGFQTEEAFRLGRTLLGSALAGLPTASASMPAARRIKVMVANGNDAAQPAAVPLVVSAEPGDKK